MIARYLITFVLAVVLVCPGCGFIKDILGISEEPESTVPTRAKVPSAKVAVKPPAPSGAKVEVRKEISPDEVIKKEVYRYIAADKRDPFRPFIILARVPGEPPLPSLQRYDIAQLNLVGIVLAGDNSKAMVEDASGKGYVVSRGTRIGRRNGVVIRIEKDLVVVEEQYKDGAGNLKSKLVSMKLYKAEEESR